MLVSQTEPVGFGPTRPFGRYPSKIVLSPMSCGSGEVPVPLWVCTRIPGRAMLTPSLTPFSAAVSPPGVEGYRQRMLGEFEPAAGRPTQLP